MTKFAIGAICLLVVLGVVRSTPVGAPLAACDTMVPQHGFDPQTSASPYATSVDATQISQGGTVHLTLASTDGSALFRGFLVIAFDVADPTETPLGSFSNVSDGKTLDCPNGPTAQNAATHQLNNDKSSVTVDWTAPAGFSGNVVFKTTYVQQADTFWVKTESDVVSVV